MEGEAGAAWERATGRDKVMRANRRRFARRHGPGKEQQDETRQGGQRGTNLARWSSDGRSIGSDRAEKNRSGGVDTGGTGTREGAGQDARQFLHALCAACAALSCRQLSVHRRRRRRRSRCPRESSLCISSSFCARWRPHRAPLKPEQGKSMCVRASHNVPITFWPVA